MLLLADLQLPVVTAAAAAADSSELHLGFVCQRWVWLGAESPAKVHVPSAAAAAGAAWLGGAKSLQRHLPSLLQVYGLQQNLRKKRQSDVSCTIDQILLLLLFEK